MARNRRRRPYDPRAVAAHDRRTSDVERGGDLIVTPAVNRSVDDPLKAISDTDLPIDGDPSRVLRI